MIQTVSNDLSRAPAKSKDRKEIFFHSMCPQACLSWRLRQSTRSKSSHCRGRILMTSRQNVLSKWQNRSAAVRRAGLTVIVSTTKQPHAVRSKVCRFVGRAQGRVARPTPDRGRHTNLRPALLVCNVKTFNCESWVSRRKDTSFTTTRFHDFTAQSSTPTTPATGQLTKVKDKGVVQRDVAVVTTVNQHPVARQGARGVPTGTMETRDVQQLLLVHQFRRDIVKQP